MGSLVFFFFFLFLFFFFNDTATTEIYTLSLHDALPIFRVRRIVTIESIQKLEWLEKTINDSKNSPNYHIAVLNTENKFPLINLVVVDNKYVILFGPHIQWSDSYYIYVENTDIATVATEYFNELWRVSDILKVGSNFNQEKLNRIKSSLIVK